jgi:hypothetical protein
MSDPKFLQTHLVAPTRQLGMAGRILFSIPDRGLVQRPNRVTAKTVQVWGDSDRLLAAALKRLSSVHWLCL